MARTRRPSLMDRRCLLIRSGRTWKGVMRLVRLRRRKDRPARQKEQEVRLLLALLAARAGSTRGGAGSRSRIRVTAQGWSLSLTARR